MRILLFLPACALLAACSDPAAKRSANTVDVAAAASRGQSDIDNYAAAARGRPSPRPPVMTLAEPGIGQSRR